MELYENVSFPEAIKRLAARAGIPIVEEEMSPEDNRRHQMRDRLLAIHAAAADWFHRNLLKTEAAQVARDYLKNRGLTGEVAKNWQIGYAPDSWEAFCTWARQKGYSKEEIIASGIAKLRDEENPGGEFYDRFRHRVMFPICNELGKVIAFSGRVLDKEAKGAKYVNSPETMLFTKGKVLFGIQKSKRALINAFSAIVCEGQLDLITIFESGIENVIASQGTAFTADHARTLKRYVGEVVLCFDADAAGQNAAEKSLPVLLAQNLTVKVAEMPPGHDPDSLIREEGPEAFSAIIAKAKDFFEYRIEKGATNPEAQTPRGKLQFAQKMAQFVSLIKDPVFRESMVHTLCTRLAISPVDFTAMLSNSKPESDGADKDEAKAAPMQLDNTFKGLCKLALTDGPARDWMAAQDWQEMLPKDQQTDLFLKILEGSFAPDDVHSVNAFISSLNEAEAGVVSALLLEKMRVDLGFAQSCWKVIEQKNVKRHLEIIGARLRQPGLPVDELLELQAEYKALLARSSSL